jgi:hypothetical protein
MSSTTPLPAKAGISSTEFSSPVTVVADLQTRLAVMETELRHMKEQREEAQLGTQALLRLLRPGTSMPLPSVTIQMVPKIINVKAQEEV